MKELIKQIAALESITPKQLISRIKTFQNSIKKSFKHYKSKEGLEEYKMELDDYVILLCIYVNTENTDNKLNIILLSMYSIYKLDDYHFSSLDFNTSGFLHFICENKVIHSLVYKLITDNTYISYIKNNIRISYINSLK